jgi:hypothetical protein
LYQEFNKILNNGILLSKEANKPNSGVTILNRFSMKIHLEIQNGIKKHHF